MKNDKKVIAAWAMYDWANSPFTTLVVTFVISAVFVQAFAPDEITGTRLWTTAVSISLLIVALCSPLLGAMADRGGFRRKFLMISTAVCVLATVGIGLISPSQDNAILLMLTVFVVANVAFEVGMVFYNAFLPDIVTKEKIGRVSGYGWALGYGGGLVALLLGLFAFVGLGDDGGWLGLSTEGAFNARATAFLVAGWLAVFSIPTFLFVRDPDHVPGATVSVRGAFADLAKAFRNIRKYREIVKFLVARIVFNDGLVTIFGISSIYAIGTFGFTLAEVIEMGIVINVAAGAGAFAFGFIDDKIGGKATVQVSLVALA
ncbi:MAG: MFS transporter, partial [Gemmatimonadetes bacterium]|nr:MFS transporter [Gemmatimonadota bacterium]